MHNSKRSSAGRQYLQPGTLWELAQTAYLRSLNTGALKSIQAVQETVDEAGISFVIWRLTQSETRPADDGPRQQKPAYSETDPNPFLPYDPALFVADITPSHVCLLNKYNILSNHLLLVTRAFEHQTTWLTLDDFEALCLCMAEYEGLAFYNSGVTAGASQRHKHLQYVSFPLGPGKTDLPISAILDTAQWIDDVGTVAAFPFVHALGRLDVHHASPDTQAAHALTLYWKLLDACAISRKDDDDQTRAYNLLATRQWMMIVPRSRESFQGISVNALGFAGSLLVRDKAEWQIIRNVGPFSVLQHVGVARTSSSYK